VQARLPRRPYSKPSPGTGAKRKTFRGSGGCPPEKHSFRPLTPTNNSPFPRSTFCGEDHIENLLLDERALFEATRNLSGSKNLYSNPNGILIDLQTLLLEAIHLRPFARALLDARVASMAKQAWDAVRNGTTEELRDLVKPQFDQIEEEGRQIMQQAIADDTWKAKCKGRDLLKAYCAKHGFRYEHFRNLTISRMEQTPQPLQHIMDQVLAVG